MSKLRELSGTNGRDLWVCSDIHGCLWHLQQALQIVKSNGGYLLVLGDAVDRGPYSKECLELIMNDSSVDMCLGNHEINWLQQGATDRVVDFLGQEICDYLLQCPLVFKYENVYMAHTYIGPEYLIEDREHDLEWWMIYENDHEWIHEWWWDYTLISGHVPSRSHPAYGKKKRRPGEVLRFGSRIFIDGGTPTTGILPLYNVIQDYEITIYANVPDVNA